MAGHHTGGKCFPLDPTPSSILPMGVGPIFVSVGSKRIVYLYSVIGHGRPRHNHAGAKLRRDSKTSNKICRPTLKTGMKISDLLPPLLTATEYNDVVELWRMPTCGAQFRYWTDGIHLQLDPVHFLEQNPILSSLSVDDGD